MRPVAATEMPSPIMARPPAPPTSSSRRGDRPNHDRAVQVLGVVLDYDAAHAGDLVTSVRVWLEHDRQTERAARALHIHPNTLLYRVRRFEQVSGCSLTSTESPAEVWLALRATAAVPMSRTGPPPA